MTTIGFTGNGTGATTTGTSTARLLNVVGAAVLASNQQLGTINVRLSSANAANSADVTIGLYDISAGVASAPLLLTKTITLPNNSGADAWQAFGPYTDDLSAHAGKTLAVAISSSSSTYAIRSNTGTSGDGSQMAASQTLAASWTGSTNNAQRCVYVETATAVATPTLSSPTGVETGQTTATVGATTDTASGTLYAIVTTLDTAPAGAQIEAGQRADGNAAAWSDNLAISSTGAKTIDATGLAAGATYYAHLVHKTTGYSNVVSSASFTTDAASSPADLTSVGTGGVVTAGATGIPYTGTDLDSPTALRLKSGLISANQTITSSNSTGGQFTHALGNLPFTTSSHAVTAEFVGANGTDTAAVTHNPASGFQVVEVGADPRTDIQSSLLYNTGAAATWQMMVPTTSTEGGTVTARDDGTVVIDYPGTVPDIDTLTGCDLWDTTQWLGAVTFTISEDITAPTVTIIDRSTGDTTPELSGTVDDPEATISVNVTDGLLIDYTYAGINLGDTWTAQVTDELAIGEYVVTVTATDSFSNSSSEAGILSVVSVGGGISITINIGISFGPGVSVSGISTL